jgi:hypothetical protein
MMGLDNYAARSLGDIELSEQDRKAFQDANIELCGGLFSGNDGSFRGKVYANYVLEVTGESLYEPWLPPETLRKMYDAMVAYQRTPEQDADVMVPTAFEHVELCKFFKVCFERGLGLVGWY